MCNYKLVLLGEVCPIPLLKTKEKVAQLKVGETLSIETDFTRSVRNIINWCNKSGHDLTVDEVQTGVWQLIVTKK